MSKSPEKNPVLTENNDGLQSKKRRRSSSPETTDDILSKCLKVSAAGKRWKGTTSAEFQPELLEELGVGMLPEASEEDRPITELYLSSSEDNENVNSSIGKCKKVLKRKKKKRQSLGYFSLRNSELTSVERLNNNSPSEEKPVIEDNSQIVSARGSMSGEGVESDSEEYSCLVQKNESDDGCVLDSCEDSSTKETKNFKWEKLKPINCKIRNSKIIYQNEITIVEEELQNDDDVKGNKVEQIKEPKNERTLKDEDDSDFFLCRRSKIKISGGGEDHFNKLSDEVILNIFRWLPKKSLVTCAMVCKRFLRVAYDEGLWTRMDLGGRNLPPKSVGHIISRGFRILRLAQAALPDPVYCPISTGLPSNFACKIQYLDLSMACISPNGLATLLHFCRSLKKLSLENCHLNKSCCTAIGGNTDLEVLNLTMCVGLTTGGIDAILSNCLRLHSLNISWTGLSVPSLNIIARKIPSKLERLNISGCKKNLTNEHVIQIFRRCGNLLELDLSDSVELTDNIINFIVKNVKKIEYLSFSRCYSIDTASFLSLKQVESLLFLDVFGLMTEEELEELRRGFGDVAVNQFPFSSVARPTVGIRRNSIWGLSLKD